MHVLLQNDETAKGVASMNDQLTNFYSQIESVSREVHRRYEELKNCIESNKKCRNKKCIKLYRKTFREELHESKINLNKYHFWKDFFQKNEACRQNACFSYARGFFDKAQEGFKKLYHPVYEEILKRVLGRIKKHAAFNKFKLFKSKYEIESDLHQEGFLGFMNAFLKFDFDKARKKYEGLPDERIYDYFRNYLKKFAYKYMLVYLLKNVSAVPFSQSSFQKLVSQKRISNYEYPASIEASFEKNENDLNTTLTIDEMLEISTPSAESDFLRKHVAKESNYHLKMLMARLAPEEEFLIRQKTGMEPHSKHSNAKTSRKVKQKHVIQKLRKDVQRIEQLKSLLL